MFFLPTFSCKACRHSQLQCSSVDAMECHGEALALPDAIEARVKRA